MKKILLIFILFTVNLKSQENFCMRYSGKLSGIDYIVGNYFVDDMKIVIIKINNEIIFNINVNDDCITENNNCIIRFNDGTKITLLNQSPIVINCADPYFSSVFNNEGMELFGKKEIESIRVSTQNGYILKQLNEKDSKSIINIVNCILKS